VEIAAGEVFDVDISGSVCVGVVPFRANVPGAMVAVQDDL
jgi:hypothetical protein